MKIYLNPDYKDHKKLEKSILEEFPEISVKSAKYNGGKKKATFVYKETCYKFENRDDLLLTLKELLDYTERKEKLGASSDVSKENLTLKGNADNTGTDKKKDDSKKDDKKKDKDSKKDDKKKDKDSKKDDQKKDVKKKDKDSKKGDKKDDIPVKNVLASVTPSGKDALIMPQEDSEEHVPTLKEILKSKDYEQIDEAFYGETAFEEREEQEGEDGDQTGSYEASLPKSVEKDDDEVMSDTFGDEGKLKTLTYEVEDIVDVKESDIMEEMGFTEGDKYLSGDSGQVSYEESIPVSEGKGDVEVLEEAYDDVEKSRTSPSASVANEEERMDGKVQPDDLMKELGYVEAEETKGQEEPVNESGKPEETVAHRKADTVEDRSGSHIQRTQGSNEIVLEVPVEKYNLNDLNIKIKFGHFNEPSSTYESKK